MFEREIGICVPSTQQRLDILSALTKHMNLHEDVSLTTIATATGGYVAGDLAMLCNIAGVHVVHRKMSNLTMKKDKGFMFNKSSTSPNTVLQSNAVTASDFNVSVLFCCLETYLMIYIMMAELNVVIYSCTV